MYEDCENCGNEIDPGEFESTGVTEYCYECAPCGDPRGHTFENCGCFDGDLPEAA